MIWNQKTVFFFFGAAALWNISAAIGALADPGFHAALFFTEAPVGSHPIETINTQAFWVTVFFFGVGYLMAGRNPQANRGVIWLGALGKTYVFFLWTWAFVQGHVTGFALTGAIGDLLFAGFFFHYLWATREEAAHGRFHLEVA